MCRSSLTDRCPVSRRVQNPPQKYVVVLLFGHFVGRMSSCPRKYRHFRPVTIVVLLLFCLSVYCDATKQTVSVFYSQMRQPPEAVQMVLRLRVPDAHSDCPLGEKYGAVEGMCSELVSLTHCSNQFSLAHQSRYKIIDEKVYSLFFLLIQVHSEHNVSVDICLTNMEWLGERVFFFLFLVSCFGASRRGFSCSCW